MPLSLFTIQLFISHVYFFRLLDFVEKGRVAFDDLQYFVLDEADRMLDMGFGPEIGKL